MRAWDCPCGVRNAVTLATCHRCGRAASVPERAGPSTSARPGRWRWLGLATTFVLGTVCGAGGFGLAATYGVVPAFRPTPQARASAAPTISVPAAKALDLAPCGHEKSIQVGSTGRCVGGHTFGVKHGVWYISDAPLKPIGIPESAIQTGGMEFAPCGVCGVSAKDRAWEELGLTYARCIDGHVTLWQDSEWIVPPAGLAPRTNRSAPRAARRTRPTEPSSRF